MKTWLITGCSTGLGRSLAKAVLQKGDNVVVTARDTKKLEEFEKDFPRTALIVRLDVTDLPSVTEAVRAAKERFGGIDVLVNNAGYGYRAAVEEGNPEDAKRLFATNFWGPVNLIKAVLPDMRARKSGAVINVSSIAALRAAPGSGYYAASKRALEGMTEGLYLETAPLGRSLTQSKTAIADYAGTAGTRRIENDKTHGTQPGDPDKGARLIIEAIEAEDAPLRLLLGSDAVRAADTVLESHKSEYDKWREFSRRSDF